MRRHAFNQRSSISRWFTPRRYYSEEPPITSKAASEAASASEAVLEIRQQPAHIGAVEDAIKGEKSLELENGVIESRKPPARRPLPLSPLMDPAYLAAKQKYKLPKAAPSKEPTPFQQKLAKNPYGMICRLFLSTSAKLTYISAKALATPVRTCRLTYTQLPSFFLQDFELIAHPSNSESWYLPRSLTSAHSSSPVPDEILSPDSIQPVGVRRGARVYVLSRASLLRATNIKNSGFTYVDGRFALNQYKRLPAFRTMKTRWRSDIDMLVLDLMRRRIVEGLKYLCGRKTGYLHGRLDWDDAKGSKQVGAFLWLGPKDGSKVAAVDKAEGLATENWGDMAADQVERNAVGRDDNPATNRQEKPVQDGSSGVAPGEFATLDMDKQMKSKVPVHNLQLLLGDDLIEDLRRHMPKVFKYEVVSLKHRRVTVDVQLRLWKLQGYLAEYKQVDDE